VRRARFLDWFWHKVYWRAVYFLGTDPDFVTDIAEQAADARIELLRRKRA
jgi:hypothetical protein